MLERELIFNYKTSLSNIYDKGVEDNADLIAVIPEIIGYEQGRWDNGKRKDWMVYKMTDIPENLRKTIEMFLNKEGEIRFRIKIYKQIDMEGVIRIKVKVKLYNFLSKIIMKIIKTKVLIEMIGDGNGCKINVKYRINSLLSKTINDKLYEYIETKMTNYFIKKIDNYIKTLE
jgi:hypothetical protein